MASSAIRMGQRLTARESDFNSTGSGSDRVFDSSGAQSLPLPVLYLSFKMNSDELRKKLKDSAVTANAEMAAGSWWHSIELGNGVITSGVHPLEELRGNYALFNLSDDLSGRSVLD